MGSVLRPVLGSSLFQSWHLYSIVIMIIIHDETICARIVLLAPIPIPPPFNRFAHIFRPSIHWEKEGEGEREGEREREREKEKERAYVDINNAKWAKEREKEREREREGSNGKFGI